MGGVCTKCGLSLREAFLIALMQECGARCSTDVIKCPGGGKHDYTLSMAKPEKEHDPMQEEDRRKAEGRKYDAQRGAGAAR